MELFGDRLRKARENKKYTLEQVARDTHITRKYLEALERGDLSQFPGETYLIGFLRSYADYLGIDQEEIIAQYKNYKIQEQPIPIAELLNPPRLSKWGVIGGSILGGLIVAGIVLILYFTVFSGHKEAPKTVEKEEAKEEQTEPLQGKEYVFENEIQTQWFNPGDIIKIPLENRIYKVELFNIERILTVKVNKSSFMLNPKEAVSLDLDDDGKNDVRIIYNDSEFFDTEPRFNIGLYKTFGGSEEIASLGENPSPEPVESPQSTETPVPTPSPEQKSDNSTLDTKYMEGTSVVIQEAKKPELFTINITFRGHCFFRYLLDTRTRGQKFFLKNDILALDVVRNAKLWISNAGTIKAQIGGKDIVFGRAGQVITKYIYWTKNEQSGLYNLEMVSLY
ncbi:MAG: helix-turn-helix domain-containing protein [Spirochaetales bacterium]|nr:helix-turn-helix domain-containing protein [Spirochaetales bacterium]